MVFVRKRFQGGECAKRGDENFALQTTLDYYLEVYSVETIANFKVHNKHFVPCCCFSTKLADYFLFLEYETDSSFASSLSPLPLLIWLTNPVC